MKLTIKSVLHGPSWGSTGWVDYRNIRLYVRRTRRYLGKTVDEGATETFELGNLDTDGKNHLQNALDLHAFFEYIERICNRLQLTMYIELIHNKAIERYVKRRGYTKSHESLPSAPSYLKPPKKKEFKTVKVECSAGCVSGTKCKTNPKLKSSRTMIQS